MKFKMGDKVKEIHAPYQTGMIMEAYKDKHSASGEWYLVFFDNEQGNQWTDGSSFIIIETDFI